MPELFSTTPHFLARSVTLSGARHTNGHATETHFSPSGALDGRECHGSIFDIPFVQLAPMLGDHLAWSNRIQDEILSWTNSWLFAIVHLYLRHLNGQSDAYLFCIDRRKATKVRDECEAREQVDFFYALPLCNATGLARYPWSAAIKSKLTYRKFTHEYLTHGIVEYSEDSDLQPVSWEDLIQGGLFTLIPEMKVPEGMVVDGLYYVLLFLPKKNYDSVKLTSKLELDTAENLARLHVRGLPTQSHQFGTKPPLVIFVYYLTLRKRGKEDALFQERVTRLGYTSKLQSHESTRRSATDSLQGMIWMTFCTEVTKSIRTTFPNKPRFSTSYAIYKPWSAEPLSNQTHSLVGTVYLASASRVLKKTARSTSSSSLTRLR